MPDVPSPSEKKSPAQNGAAFPVVGIGASAGGLEALRGLLAALPVDTGMGFVIVQHLAPAHASSLAEILARATKMPVCEVRDEPAVEPDHVYVIPPGRDMIITGGRLLLLPQERNARHRGIDQFFRSLAEDSGHQAIGVVLSGSATDGTLGLEVIKAEGGVTFAQDESAQHDSMPKSAVASGCVDFVLPPEGIAKEIARIARHPYVAVAVVEENGADEEPGHGRIAEIMRRATGVDFTHYKTATMQRRIQRRMMVHKIETLTEYEDHLRATPGEVEALYQDVLISVTSFFRNPEAFEVLAKKIFPKVLAERTRQEPVRIWTLGCSTGEEAYSLAMLFAECAETAKSNAQVHLFASDLNASCIERARVGRYPRSISQDVSPDRLRRFFVEEDGHYRVNKGIRERVVFSRHNVLADPPFSRVDFISCRNLLIYLEPVLQQQIMPLLHYALKPGGHLWLGSSESVGTSRALFEVEDARQKIFTRKPGPTPPGTRFRPGPGGTTFPTATPTLRETPATQLHRDAERVLLAKYAPPGVVVNAGLHVVQFRGDTGAYLAPAAGLASHELLKMLREGLLVPVRTALARAESEGHAVREEGARVKSEGGHRELAIEVIPLKAGPGREAGFIVLFDEGARPAAHESHSSHESHGTNERNGTNDSDELARLTQELSSTREYLQSVIEQQDSVNEELQSANEEAQSANEEMQSVNEELETSKEEIQSSNEELATVNDELNNRNHELNTLNNDLTNVFASAQLSIVILSRDLRIRRFTPVAEKTLNLAAGDVSRPLGDIKLSLTIPDLAPLLREVIDSLTPRERDVQDAQGRWFSLRARPYLTHDNRIDGAVVTLVDVDTLRRARDYAENIVANVRVPLVVLDTALRVRTASRAFYEHFRVALAETEGRPIYDLGNRQWDIPALRTLLEEILPEKNEIADYEVRHTFEELGPRIMLLNAHRLAQAADDEPLIIVSLEDITDREAGAEAVRGSEERFRMVADNMSQLAWTCDQLGDVTWYNQRWLDYTGLTFAEMKDWGWKQCQHPDHVERVVDSVTHSRETGEPWEDTFPLRGGDGQYRWFLSRAFPIRDAAGKVVRWFGTNTDITERRDTEDALRRSEQRFRTAVSTVSSLIWTNNAVGMMEGEQPGWGNFTGQKQEEYQGYGWAKAVHPEDAQPTIDGWEEAVAEKRMFVGEHRVRRADGEWRLCSIRAVPMLGDDGAILEWVGVHTDITERKRSEEILRASEERARALVTASSDVVYRMNADWSEMGPLDGRNFISDAAEPSRTWLDDNIFPEDHPQILAAIREAIRTKGVFALDHRVRRADGSEGWTVSKAVPILDARGEITEWFGAASDVTERHQAEEALRTSEEFKRSIIESSPDCIKVLDLEGRLLSLEAGHALLGITDITPLLGTSWIDLWVREEDHAAASAAVAVAGAGGEGKFVGFFRTLHGLDKWWDVAVTPIRDGGGKVTRLLSVSRDVTERRELEETLVARAQELVQADRSKDEFLAMLAHELRNPLAPLRNAAEILQAAGVSTGERAQAQRIIGRQIENMSRMIDDLLDVSRITEGKISLRKKPVALEAILTAATSLARSGCAARHQELALTLPADPVFLNADATRLEQVFGNLLTNACKYSGDGSHIALTAEVVAAGGSSSSSYSTPESADRVGVGGRGGEGQREVLIRVTDDGIGIEPEMLPHVFDLFVQASRTLDRAHGGLGIGLTLVHRLVKLHGGSIDAHSDGLGHGAEFTVRLPTLAEAPPPEPPPPPPAVRDTPRRMLIVDDNTDSARSLATLQKRRGHETRTAFTGPEAVTAAAEFQPEVVLLDIGLPGMDGFEVARNIRAMPALKGVFIIAMSGYGRDEDRVEAKLAGFDEYLVKPIDLDQLREWLHCRARKSDAPEDRQGHASERIK